LSWKHRARLLLCC